MIPPGRGFHLIVLPKRQFIEQRLNKCPGFYCEDGASPNPSNIHWEYCLLSVSHGVSSTKATHPTPPEKFYFPQNASSFSGSVAKASTAVICPFSTV